MSKIFNSENITKKHSTILRETGTFMILIYYTSCYQTLIFYQECNIFYSS